MGPNLDPINRNFEAQVGLHFGGGLGGHVAPQSTFLEAQVGLLVRGSKLTNYPFYYHFLIGIKPKMDNWPTWTPNKEPNLGLQKIFLWRPRRPDPPSKMDPNLGLKKLIWGAYLVVRFGHHVGDLKAPKRFF